jgi:hypothetical protein
MHSFFPLFYSVAVVQKKPTRQKPFAANEDFNVFPKSKKNVLTIVKTDSGAVAAAVDRFAIQSKDTTITIDDTPNATAKKFIGCLFYQYAKNSRVSTGS